MCNCCCVLKCPILAPIYVFALTILGIYVSLSTSPSFIIHDVKLYAFNVSTTTATLTSTLQITISCENKQGDHGIHFDKIDVYTAYKKQQITPPIALPPRYLGSSDVALWSPYLNGTEVPLSPYLASSLAQDMTAGVVQINVMVTGRMRLKQGFISHRHRLKVDCLTYITFGNKNNSSNVVGSAVKHPFENWCR
ncbi:putative protein NDR1 [Helianthus annuus]|nr:putative protein NDR1 [Helianthus annuus]